MEETAVPDEVGARVLSKVSLPPVALCSFGSEKATAGTPI